MIEARPVTSRTVITGVGCITPIGIGMTAFSDALRNGLSGVGPLTQCDGSSLQCRVAAQVNDFDPLAYMDLKEARALPRVAQFAVAACRLAIADAGIRQFVDQNRVGVVIGTSSGPIAYALEQHAIFLERGARRVHPSSPAFGHNSVISSECAIQLNLRGPAFTLSSACTSATDAIGLGQTMIQAGVADALLVGGADAPICSSILAAFERLGLLPRGFNHDPAAAARPFDARRDGLVLGEGAGIVVLERADVALRRDARILAEVVGYGSTCDASSHFQQETSGDDATRAIQLALSSLGCQPGDIDYVNAHGTGTRENDPFEAKVLRRVFGANAAVAVSSSKSQFGHLLGASGAVELAAVVAGMVGSFAPPTLNLDEPDTECLLNHVPHRARTMEINYALSTNFGFGSRNAALALRKWMG